MRKAVLHVLFIAILILFSTLFLDIFNDQKGSLINISSSVPNTSINFKNKSELLSIAEEVNLLDKKKYFDWNTRKEYPFSSIHIVFTPEEQPQRKIVDSNGKTLESFSQELVDTKLTLKIYLDKATYQYDEKVSRERVSASIIRTLYLNSPSKSNYFKDENLQKELDILISKYNTLSVEISRSFLANITYLISQLRIVNVVEAGCNGTFFCGQNVTVRRCSVAGYDHQCSSCNDTCANTGEFGEDVGTCSCVNQCNPNAGYEEACSGMVQASCNTHTNARGSQAMPGCDCSTANCRWSAPPANPPAACNGGSACGGLNQVTGNYCPATHRFFTGNCTFSGYNNPGCYPSNCPAPNPTAPLPTRTPTPRPNQPTNTPVPTDVPECTPGTNSCSPQCRTCNGLGKWFLNASNGCHDWSLCECLNSGKTMAQCTAPPPVTGSCDSSCGFCGWRDSNGQCRTGPKPDGKYCCRKGCANGTCTTINGEGDDEDGCTTLNAACAPAPTSAAPQACVQGNACTCSGASAAACAQCGNKWCNGGRCDCNTNDTPDPCRPEPLNCTRFTATVGTTTVKGIDTISSQNGVEIPTIEVLPNEKVTFASNIITGCDTEETKFTWENNTSCIENFSPAKSTDPATTARWCNTTVQASATGLDAGVSQGIQCNDDMKDDNCRCFELDAAGNSNLVRCKDAVDRNAQRLFTNAGDYLIKSTQINSANRNESGRNPCLINVRVKCPTIAQGPASLTVQEGSTNVTVSNDGVGFILNEGVKTINWPAVTGATGYSVRINEYGPAETERESWAFSCAPGTIKPGDRCLDLTGTSLTHDFNPNKKYRIWVHPRNDCGSFGPKVAGNYFYAPKGDFQSASCTTLAGWACDLDNATQSIDVDIYADGPIGTGRKIPGTFTANGNNGASSGQCDGVATHGFSIPLPDELKDGKQHTLYAYGKNIGEVTTDRLLANTRTINECAEAWIKLGNSSFSRPSTATTVIENKIPSFVKPYDANDTAEPVFIHGANSAGSALKISIGNFADTKYGNPHNWSDSEYDPTSAVFTIDQYVNYIKARKNYKNIANVNDINGNGIYLFSASENGLIQGNESQYDYVLIVPGNGGITIASNNASKIFNEGNKSIAIIAKKITFDGDLKQANGIFIAEQIDTGTNQNQGLKINGNAIATANLTLNRQSKQDQNTVPALYVVQDMKYYLDLLPYLSTSIYESKQVE